MTRLCALALALAGACASAPRAPVAAPPTSSDDVTAGVDARDEEALRALVRRASEGDASAVGVPLARAGGALSLSGEAAPDDRVASAATVARVGASAAVLVTTACGNAWVVGLGLRARRWEPVSRVALVDDAAPGRCRVSRAEASACAMLTAEAREVVATWVSESEEGDEARDPALRVVHLDDDGALRPLGEPVAFGGTDDHSGAVRDAQWVVDESFPTPRDLYVQIQPGRAGPGGTAPPFVVRRTYRPGASSLTLVDEESAPWRPPRR